MFHEWARHLRDVKRSIYVYVKRDVCILEKRRVDSIYEWAMSHARARYLRDVKRNIYIYLCQKRRMYVWKEMCLQHMSKETYTSVKRDIYICQKRRIHLSKEKYIYIKETVMSHAKARLTRGVKIDIYISFKRDIYICQKRRM